ncbi:MAG: prepilin-type N-terminal cleavage/methylation domain-containing protein [Deltaproteobacteria bacterium]|nr:prepilin-type N-terminal cleavage/methylation domain-containing protein [Deltaproteobacteria bacterium]
MSDSTCAEPVAEETLVPTRRRRRVSGVTVFGFTLLEVMISVAILAMGLSTVFGSNVIAARRVAHARMLTQATLAGQCRMTELEAWLRRNQLPQTDERPDDPPDMSSERCCVGEFRCEAHVDKIVLPDPPEVNRDATSQLMGTATQALQGTQFGAGGAGGAGGASPLAALAGALGGLGANGAPQVGQGAMSGAGGAGGAPDVRGAQAAVLSGIYPSLKPLLEGAIRKVSVRVAWNEGSREFSFELVQYVTNPGQTLQSGPALPPGAANAINSVLQGAGGLLGGSGGTPGQGIR